jgi:ABC-type antimicrobial peptide transport system permease subunit
LEPALDGNFARRQAQGEDLAAAAREQIWAADRDLLVFAVPPMDQVVSESIAAPKLRAVLLGSFAGLALFLAIIGLASLVAYGVTQRTHEFGVRLALGAAPRDILFQVLGQGMQLTLLGVAIGVVVALALTRLISALLFGVPPGDPLTFAGVSVVRTVVALAACYIPARRAMRVDPMVALRYE